MYIQGIFNAQKCIAYLRGIGVEIDDATAASWADAEKAHRFLGKMKRTAAHGWDWWCSKGHQNYREWKAGSRRSRYAHGDKCSVCGAPLTMGSVRWTETHDGTFHDYRPKSERWKPRDWQTFQVDSGGLDSGDCPSGAD